MISTNHIFCVFAFIGFFSIILLLPIHVKGRNVGTSAYIVWTALLCLNGFVNAIIWDRNVVNSAPVWCDISSRLIMAGPVGMLSAGLCVFRRLYRTAKNIIAEGPSQDEDRALVVDLLIAIGIPVLYVILSYVDQNRRFYIFEEIGCYHAIYNTIIAYPLLLVWTIVLAIAATSYAVGTIHILRKWRAKVKDTFTQQHGDHFYRLLAMVSVGSAICLIPSIVGLVETYRASPNAPWPGWDAAHARISEVVQVTAVEWQAAGFLYSGTLQFSRWAYVLYSGIFFAFFGLSVGARKMYCLSFNYFPLGKARTPDVLPDV